MKILNYILPAIAFAVFSLLLLGIGKYSNESVVITPSDKAQVHTLYCQQILDGEYVYEEETGYHYCRTDLGYTLLGVDK